MFWMPAVYTAARRGSFAALRVFDALRSVPLDASGGVRFDEAQWHLACNQYTLPDFARYIPQMSFMEDITKQRNSIIQIFNKCIPCICHTRKSGTTAESVLFEAADELALYEAVMQLPEWRRGPARVRKSSVKHRSLRRRKREKERFVAQFTQIATRREQFKLILLCSLLGNYDHVERRIQHLPTRRKLEQKLAPATVPPPSPRNRGQAALADCWFQSILHGCSSLFEWSLREYIVHVITTRPGLATALSRVFHVDAFIAITKAAMAAARVYFEQNLTYAWSSLGQSVDAQVPALCVCMNKLPNVRKGQTKPPKPLCLYGSQTWLQDMERLLAPFHLQLLRDAWYRKPDECVLAYLMSREVRLAAPLVPRPLNAEEKLAQEAVARKQAEDEHKREHEREFQRTVARARALHSDAQQLENLAAFEQMYGGSIKDMGDAAKKPASSKSRVVVDVYTYIRPGQFRFLADLVETRGFTTLNEIVPHFGECARVSPTVIQYILTLLTSKDVTKRENLKRIRQLRLYAPHAYNLMQISVELLRVSPSRCTSVVGTFSQEVLDMQIDAVQRKGLEALQADDQHRMTICEEEIRLTRRSFFALIANGRVNCHHHHADDYVDDVVRSSRPTCSGECCPKEINPSCNYLFYLKTVARPLIQARLDSIRQDWEKSRGIEHSSVHLHVCGVCNEVYSNVVVKEERTAGDRSYRWGKRDAVRNSVDQQVYCSRDRVNHKGACWKTPLKEIPLLGVRYTHARRVYQICAGCGDTMVPDLEWCIYTERGLVCYRCSLRRMQALATPSEEDVLRTQYQEKRCIMRNCVISGKQSAYFYPYGITMCRRHHRKAMMEYISSLLPRLRSREQTLEAMQNYIAQRRSSYQDRMRPQWDRNMKLARRRQNQKRGRR